MIRQHDLPIQLFRDLLSAFAQDVTKTRYNGLRRGDELPPARQSGGPVLLHLFGETDPAQPAYRRCLLGLATDQLSAGCRHRLCQGTDLSSVDELRRFGIAEAQFASGDMAGRWRPFMRFQIERARRILQAGAPLGRVLRASGGSCG
jgi:phytoene/squalene synthetase